MKEEYFEEARRGVCEYVNTQVFDAALVITADRKTEKLWHWYAFTRHSSEWSLDDMRELALRMSSQTASMLKKDCETKEQPFIQRGKKRIVFQGPRMDLLSLFILGVGWPNVDKPVWFYVEISTDEIAVGIRWWFDEEPATGNPYWALRFLLGPLRLGLSRRK